MDPAMTLREARTRAGFTQAALARRAGTSQATVSAYEQGHKQPTVETFIRLLAATGSRLAVEPGKPSVVEPTAMQRTRAARSLIEVLALADALPTRHEPQLRFPRLIVTQRVVPARARPDPAA